MSICQICKREYFFGGTDLEHDFSFCNQCLHKIFGKIIIDKLDDCAIELELEIEFRLIINKYKQKHRLSIDGIV